MSDSSRRRAVAGAPARGGGRASGDRVFRGASLAIAAGLIALLALMLWVLASGGGRAFEAFGFGFLVGKDWNPVAGREQFGALPFIFGTLVTSASRSSSPCRWPSAWRCC